MFNDFINEIELIKRCNPNILTVIRGNIEYTFLCIRRYSR